MTAREGIAPIMTASERLTDEQLGNALANAIDRLTDEAGARITSSKQRQHAGWTHRIIDGSKAPASPSLPKLAEQLGVPLETLCDVFAEEIFRTTGHIIGARGRLQ